VLTVLTQLHGLVIILWSLCVQVADQGVPSACVVFCHGSKLLCVVSRVSISHGLMALASQCAGMHVLFVVA
jgi:hypothetical protein